MRRQVDRQPPVGGHQFGQRVGFLTPHGLPRFQPGFAQPLMRLAPVDPARDSRHQVYAFNVGELRAYRWRPRTGSKDLFSDLDPCGFSLVLVTANRGCLGAE